MIIHNRQFKNFNIKNFSFGASSKNTAIHKVFTLKINLLKSLTENS